MKYLISILCLFVFSCDYVKEYNAKKSVNEFLDCMVKGGYGFPCSDYFLSEPLVDWEDWKKDSNVNSSNIEVHWEAYKQVYLKSITDGYYESEGIGKVPYYASTKTYYDLYSKAEWYGFEIVDLAVKDNVAYVTLHSKNKFGVNNKMYLDMRNGKKGWKVTRFR